MTTYNELVGIYTGIGLEPKSKERTEWALKNPAAFIDNVHVVSVETGAMDTAALLLAFARRLSTAVFIRGETCPKMFNTGKAGALFSRLTGFKPKELSAAADVRERMVVGGPVAFETLANCKYESIHYVHLYGINLEGKTSSEFKLLDGKSSAEAKPYIDRITRKTWAAATRLIKMYGCNAVHVPAVGLGAYITKRTDLKKVIINAFMKAMLVLIKDPGFVLVLAIPDVGLGRTMIAWLEKCAPEVLICLSFSQWISAEYKTENVVVFTNDLFDLKVPRCSKPCLVNAWDTRSLIGNGLNRDNTVDGFAVAGMGYGNKLPTSAFAHNVFLLEKARKALADVPVVVETKGCDPGMIARVGTAHQVLPVSK